MQQIDLSAFPAATREDWLKRVDAVLKGAGFDTLVSQNADGIEIAPLYGEAQGPRAERAAHAPWTVHQRADHPDAARANAQALDDLAHGATGLTLTFKGHASARGFGLVAKDLPRLLDGVALHAMALRLEGGAAEASALAAMIARQPVDPGRLDVSFGLESAELAGALAAQGFCGPFLEADGRPWHDKGATEAQELGAVLAAAVGYLRALGRPALGITLAAGQDMFLTLAKFRAMRLLWRRVLEASGLADEPLRIHAETSWRMMARLDPHTNILRAAAAVTGAGLGGADSICALPFPLAQGLPDAFARRVARNVQNVLLEEANLWRVADPASGSGYVEHLTQELCEKAWSVFQKIEKNGAWPEPDAQAAPGSPIIGTSAYRLDKEFPAAVERLR